MEELAKVNCSSSPGGIVSTETGRGEGNSVYGRIRKKEYLLTLSEHKEPSLIEAGPVNIKQRKSGGERDEI